MTSRIRPETTTDHQRVREINTLAFETTSEADLVEGLRREADSVVSLVAEQEGVVAGHIMLTPVAIGDTPASTATMGLNPLSVHPDHQDSGIGIALLEAALAVCATNGTEIIVTLGHPDYYGRLGFELAVEEGISYVGREYDSFFLVKELVPGSCEKYQGEVKFHRLIEEL